jgi:hypothetical protein
MESGPGETVKVTPKSSGLPSVPTTKILALGRFTDRSAPETIQATLRQEVPETVRLYLTGKIDQWWFNQRQRAPVFLLNVTTVEEAHALMEALPLGQAGLMEFDFIELGPLTPLHLLLGPKPASDSSK